jgi:hypothetical protein
MLSELSVKSFASSSFARVVLKLLCVLVRRLIKSLTIAVASLLLRQSEVGSGVEVVLVVAV